MPTVNIAGNAQTLNLQNITGNANNSNKTLILNGPNGQPIQVSNNFIQNNAASQNNTQGNEIHNIQASVVGQNNASLLGVEGNGSGNLGGQNSGQPLFNPGEGCNFTPVQTENGIVLVPSQGLNQQQQNGLQSQQGQVKSDQLNSQIQVQNAGQNQSQLQQQATPQSNHTPSTGGVMESNSNTNTSPLTQSNPNGSTQQQNQISSIQNSQTNTSNSSSTQQNLMRSQNSNSNHGLPLQHASHPQIIQNRNGTYQFIANPSNAQTNMANQNSKNGANNCANNNFGQPGTSQNMTVNGSLQNNNNVTNNAVNNNPNNGNGIHVNVNNNSANMGPGNSVNNNPGTGQNSIPNFSQPTLIMQTTADGQQVITQVNAGGNNNLQNSQKQRPNVVANVHGIG